MIKYHNALDKEGYVIPIAAAQTGITYYCIGCGNEMVAKKGQIKEHHFSHKHTLECNAETYLHKYTKSFIKEMFDKQDHFPIAYNGTNVCLLKDECDLYDYNCSESVFRKFDLKDYYDTCELEKEYKGFVADILLSSQSHPNRKPCFIEIAVSHPCEPEKLRSGIRIIEISIPKQIDDLSGLSINEGCSIDNISIKFYNFNREGKSNHPLELQNVPVFFINSNNKGELLTHLRSCSSYGKTHLMDNSSFEIHFSNEFSAYKTGVSLANLHGKRLKNCWVCRYHWYADRKIIDKHRCNKNYQIVSPSDAIDCPEYAYSTNKARKIIEDCCCKYKVLEPRKFPEDAPE